MPDSILRGNLKFFFQIRHCQITENLFNKFIKSNKNAKFADKQFTEI